MKCCICKGEIEKKKDPETGKVYWEGGNDPWPISLKDGDRCCDKCDMEVVLPARLERHENAKA